MTAETLADGLHLTADLTGCAPEQPWMHHADTLRQACIDLVHRHGLRCVGDCFHQFPAPWPGQPGGVTGVLLLAESHLAVHTWPERGHVTIDVFVCNVGIDNSARAQALMTAFSEGFRPRQVRTQAMRRGMPLAPNT